MVPVSALPNFPFPSVALFSEHGWCWVVQPTPGISATCHWQRLRQQQREADFVLFDGVANAITATAPSAAAAAAASSTATAVTAAGIAACLCCAQAKSAVRKAHESACLRGMAPPLSALRMDSTLLTFEADHGLAHAPDAGAGGTLELATLRQLGTSVHARGRVCASCMAAV
eukprot:365139-Chlamydomonas_euryale.AAC.14